MGLAVALFLGLFAFDSFDGRPLAVMLPAFALHLLPAAIVGLVVAAAWRHPLVGVVAFAMLAIGYAAWVPHRLDWILVISGPLALTAALHAMSAADSQDRDGQRAIS
jgi:CHASE2 domain-containing sensor protein